MLFDGQVILSVTLSFQTFYDSKTSHRRLQWIYALGNATVKGTFSKKSYDLQVADVYSYYRLDSSY